NRPDLADRGGTVLLRDEAVARLTANRLTGLAVTVAADVFRVRRIAGRQTEAENTRRVVDDLVVDAVENHEGVQRRATREVIAAGPAALSGKVGDRAHAGDVADDALMGLEGRTEV